ncbi:Acyl-CoA dehydrogenase type 2 domain protein [Pseudarthrobacter chlorophenolicus A6]|uniref:Acyl-CoA dehydrogenase type 2 domain protein n=1 Tax=Pseudarthrobacter chlorophenolicus (strain ATCC 700700 / DSM 12829 / CIP 107037 / JCM 12360 / KCTC 9906 / NCIMB 13794 / A6) TaxID=452863 RepID=B8H8K3_PSECP|nr:acyl-CoA dehydrogenase family protein [Pseudarthrobacter chlorophenolicus]ACL39881.1 Acyl-CoA dehydrogenase type 2 domain protein [Pseudarthrobacter chlorophenolicus A6]SDQ91999.1 Acyl-CoA dehydrogenase [Pseudarthrobacter chlorophenolicus]
MTPEDVLPQPLLEKIRGRAADYDRNNGFFHEDLRDLAEAGYLKLFVPADDGGLGLGLAAAAQCQRRLATAAPATALATNMHLVWTGVAHVLKARGDHSLDFVLDEAAQGEVFAFGNSEAGNDSVLFDSRTVAEPLPGGGYRFEGTKIFTSLSPAWTRLGIFGKDAAARDGAGELVHGFITRAAEGYRILDDWDTLGMRASQSATTVLDGVEVPADRIFRKLPVGPNADPLIFAIFACFETLLAAVYAGLGERALTLGVENAKRRTSFKNGGRSYAQDPDIRWKVADAAMAMDNLYPQLASVAADVDALAEHGPQWFPKLVGLKVNATETARRVVDLAIRVSGGSSYFRGSELERLYRDVLAGMFHPSDDESAHNTVANAWLGPLDS